MPRNTTPNLVRHLNDMFEQGGHSGPARSVHASQIGFPCERRLVYDQVAATREAPDLYLQRLFAVGSLIGRQAARDLSEALEGTGMEVSLQEEPLPPNVYGIGGRLDLSVGGRDEQGIWRIPIEVKSCSPFVFAKIRDVESLMSHPSVHVRGWYDQVQTYLVLGGHLRGILLMRDRSSGEYRQVEIILDQRRADELLAKAARITKAVADYRDADPDDLAATDAALPERMQFSGDTCSHCEHRGVCLPDMEHDPAIENIMWDVELEAYCRMREENHAAAKAFRDADEAIKAHGKGVAVTMAMGDKKTQLLGGGFTVSIAQYASSRYDVPMDIKAPYKKAIKCCRVTVDKLDSGGADAT